MIKIYGSPRSSAGRCFLLLEELGVPYQPVELDMMGRKEHKSPDYLKLNPNGKVPCLMDGDYILWESLAINQYLAEKYGKHLLGKTPEENGLIQQWSLWALTELQPPLVDIIIQMVFVPEEKRDMQVVTKAKEKIPPLLKILNEALNGETYLVASRLTLADFNVLSVVNIAISQKMDLSGYLALMAWLEGLRQRPAFQRLMGLRNK